MNAKDVIRHTMQQSDFIANSYLNDLSDDELFIRPVPGMNHLAWQLGHLIWAERWFMEAVQPGASPALPGGFDDLYNKEGATSDDRSKFRSKQEYIALWKAQRAATEKILDSLPESRLDEQSPEAMRSFVPTVGAMFNMVGVHPLMHVGQWVAVRRRQKKPVAI